MDELLQLADSLEANELHRAVQENHLEAVKFLIKKGVDVTYPIDGDRTPLHIAVKNNNEEIAEVLCKSTTRTQVRRMIDRQTSHGDSALRLAEKNNSFEITRLLFSYGANLDELRRTPGVNVDERIEELVKSIDDVFEWTEECGSPILLKKLNCCPIENLPAVMYARKEQSHFSHRNRDTHSTRDCTVLQRAMGNRDLEQIEIIINRRIDKLRQAAWLAGGNIDKLAQHSKAARCHFKNLNESWTHRYAKDSKKEAANLLHSSFAFLEAYRERGDCVLDNQPLLIVIEEALEYFEYWEGEKVMKRSVAAALNFSSEHTEQMLKLCVIAPMLLFMKIVYTSELLEAAKQNNLSKVEMCLTGHPDLNKTDDATGYSALYHAIRNEKIAKLLLNSGADPTVASLSKETPLHAALRRPEGCSLSKTPRVSSDVVLLMLENTSDDELIRCLNARTERDRSTPRSTPLHLAVKRNNHRLVEFLLTKGCVYCPRDASGRVPSYYLNIHDNESISNLLTCTERSFAQARNGKIEELIEAMGGFDANTLLAAGGACDEENRTLDQVLELEGHANEADAVGKS